MNLTEKKELYILLDALRENVISDKHFDRLDQIIADDPEAAKEYLRYVKLWTDLQFFQAASQKECNDQGVTDMAVWEALANYEMNAPAVQLPQIKAEQESLATELISKVEHQKSVRTINKTSIVSFLLSAAAVLLIVLFVKIAPSKSSKDVAVLADSINATWSGVSTSMIQGSHFSIGDDDVLLREGVAQLKFENNAIVTIEGPAEFDIVAGDRINLHYGRLYSIVPQEAIGFSVKTPNAMVIDLGTQFGIDVDLHGNTNLHVTQGKTTLVSTGGQEKNSMTVNEHSAKKVSRVTGNVTDIPCNNTLFARTINSKMNAIWRGQPYIDLSDMFCGGKGLGGGNPEESIDPASGQIQVCIGEDREGNGQYIEVPEREFVDGVFVPNPDLGSVIVSSQQHVFAECPKTNNIYFFDIHKGIDLDILSFENGKNIRESLMLHANAGITFDLDAIRAACPQATIERFTSWVGLSLNEVRQGNADAWVLVDGEVRFNQKQINEKGKPYRIDVDINESDRFLTLVITDGEDIDLLIESGRATDSDWCLFVEPQLELSF